MDIIFYIFIFIFGTIIGSFLNVVIYRLGTGTGVTNGRSMCFSCGKSLRWYELIPIVSFMVQSGRCRVCKSKISRQYPIVETLTGFLFLLVIIQSGVSYVTIWSMNTEILLSVFYWVIISVLIVIAVYDLRHKIIPNSFVYAFISLSFINLFFQTDISIWYWLAGPILFSPFAFLWLVSRGRWMGFGDAKLAWGIGWFLGLYYGASAIVLSFWIGAVWGVGLIMLSHLHRLFPSLKQFTMKSEIPFGPFLLFGTILTFFFGIDAFSLAQFFSV